MEKYFKDFCKEIRLTSYQESDAQTKYTNVCKTLHNSYYENEYDEKNKLLFGSYRTKTNIRPISEMQDVDVLFKIPEEIFDKFENYKSNGQSALLQEIRDVLKKTYSTTDRIRGWGKVVLVKMSDGKHNVEVLPAFEKDDGTFLIPDTKNGGSWEPFDPRQEIKKFRESNKTANGLTAELTKMLKSWVKNTSTLSYTSYDLLNDVIDFLHTEFTSGAEYDEYHEVIRNFFDYIYHRCTDDDRKSHIETAYNRTIKAIEYMDEDKLKEASVQWRLIFGKLFPEVKSNIHIPPVVKPIKKEISPWSKLYYLNMISNIYTKDIPN